MQLGKYSSYEHAVFCITVYVHRLIYSIKMIALLFSEEAWQGDKILIYLLIKVSNEVTTYLRETGPFRAILVRETH